MPSPGVESDSVKHSHPLALPRKDLPSTKPVFLHMLRTASDLARLIHS